MSTLWIILITVSCLYLLTFIPLLKISFIQNIHERKFYQSINLIKNNLGFTISINGSVGTGKTALASGFGAVYTMIFQNEIQRLLKYIKRILFYVNFDEFNECLIYLIEQNSNLHLNYIRISEALIKIFNIQNYYHYDFVTPVSTNDLILDYVIAFDAFYIRNNYVFSKTRFFNPVIFKTNLTFDISATAIIKEPTKFNLKPYSVVIHDEASDDKAADTWREEITSGTKQFKSKIRHIFKEKLVLINIKQDYTDEVKKERTLNQSLLDMQGLKKLNNPKPLFKLLRSYYNLTSLFYRYRLRFRFLIRYIKTLIRSRIRISYYEFLDSIYNQEHKLRRLELKSQNLASFFEAQRTIEFEFKLYKKEKDFGKEIASDFLYIPLKYCFSYPRFEYEETLQDLLKQSKAATYEDNYFKKKSLLKENISKTYRKDDNFEFWSYFNHDN